MIKKVVESIKKFLLSLKEGFNGFKEKFSKKMRECEATDFFKNDELEFKNAFNYFFELVQRISPPHVVGLYGGWGSGKTRMINELVSILEHAGNKTLVFDAWQCRDDLRLAPALIKTLCEKHKIKELSPIVAGLLLIIFFVLIMFLAIYLGFVVQNSYFSKIGSAALIFFAGGLPFTFNGVKSFFSTSHHIVKFFSQSSLDEPTPSKAVEKTIKRFKKIVDRIINKNKKQKLIIFVDNLDRCLPDRVVPLIEDVANYFNKSSSCIFVLAMDKQHVAKAIENEHPGFDGREYLEKIIQTGFDLPIAKPSKAASFFQNKFRESYKTYFDTDAPDVTINALHEPVEALFSGKILSNPRRIELFSRKLAFFYKLYAPTSEGRIFLALVFIILKEQFNAVYEVCRQNGPSSIQKFLQIVSWSVSNDPEQLRKQPENAQLNFFFPEFRKEFMGNRHFYEFIQKCQRYRKSKKLEDGSPGGQELLAFSAELLNLIEIV